MNPSIKKLVECSAKKSRRIIGLMSGTSLDGLDIVLCKVTGHGEHTKVEQQYFDTKSYDDSTKQYLKKISSVDDVKLNEICYVHTWLAHLHAKMIVRALEDWGVKPEEVDCIASHGQTIYHLPARNLPTGLESINSTLQIGDGDHIAAKTGILTISDFRQKHVAHGGEGAPMAGLVDEMLFADENEPRILLNIGGIGNFTYVPVAGSLEKSFTTDTGPGNTLIDKWVQKHFSVPFDKDSKIALSGEINPKLVELLLQDSWFTERSSKTTGPEYFSLNWLQKCTKKGGFQINELPPEDVAASLTEFSAYTISESISSKLQQIKDAIIYVSGGGVHNPFLMQRLSVHLSGIEIKNFSDLEFDPDAKEAIIFAVLANEMIAGQGFSFPTQSGKDKIVNFGKFSFPE